MKKTLKDFAIFLRDILPQEIPQTYSIDTKFYNIADEKDIREGIFALKDFLLKLYNQMISEDNSYQMPKKEAHEFSDNTNITSYPFMLGIGTILINIGLKGLLSQSSDSLLLDDIQSFTAKNNVYNAKMSNQMKKDCLLFLINCGMQIDNLDLKVNTVDSLSNVPLMISYPDNPNLLIGLKVMAMADEHLVSSPANNNLFRCDYRVLANEEINIFLALNDLIKPLPTNIQEFIVNFHQSYMENGYKCLFNTKNLYIRFEYYCRSKELWRLNISMNNGYSLSIKAQNMHQYPEVVAALPYWLQKNISQGYGCGKKKGITTCCNGGCRGFRVPLDNSFMEISNDVEKWFNKEILCLQKN